nr:GNAT family N-acetyltransferase [uncultured Carboxylicivirga sp.]
MEQRLTIITLGVTDLIESERFYSKIIGWKKTGQSNENIIFYNLNGFQLALYQIDKLAEDAKMKSINLDFRGFTLAYNLRTENEVDLIFDNLLAKGVEITKKPERASWGGYSGYFADPDKNLWEVAYNPYLQLDKNGNTVDSEKTEISLAELTDLDKILELQKEAYVQEAEIYNDFNIQPLTQNIDLLKLEWQKGIVIKAEKNGQIIGSVRADLVDNICKIGKLIVKPDFQNQGIGKSLMTTIEKLFDNCLIYELFTGDKSEKNLKLYRKLGYKDYKTEQIDNNLKLVYLQKQNNVIA